MNEDAENGSEEVEITLEPGHKTTEFWVSMVAAIIVPIFGILVLDGVLSKEEAELYEHLILGSIPLAMAIIAGSYTHTRGKIKREHVKVKGKIKHAHIKKREKNNE